MSPVAAVTLPGRSQIRAASTRHFEHSSAAGLDVLSVLRAQPAVLSWTASNRSISVVFAACLPCIRPPGIPTVFTSCPDRHVVPQGRLCGQPHVRVVGDVKMGKGSRLLSRATFVGLEEWLHLTTQLGSPPFNMDVRGDGL